MLRMVLSLVEKYYNEWDIFSLAAAENLCYARLESSPEFVPNWTLNYYVQTNWHSIAFSGLRARLSFK